MRLTSLYRVAGRLLEVEGPPPGEPGWAATRVPLPVQVPGPACAADPFAIPSLRLARAPACPPPPEARPVLRSPAGRAWEEPGPPRVVHLEAGGRTARAVPAEGSASWSGPGDALAHPLGEMLVTTLLEGRALELHGAAVTRGEWAWALVGVSGAGKSTLSGLWSGLPGWRRLAEERLLAWPGAAGWRVEAAPWPPGVERSPGEARLAGILLLARGERPRLEPVSPAAATAALLRATFFLSGSEASLRAVGGLAAALAREVPVLRLSTPASAEALAEAAAALPVQPERASR